MRKEIKQFRDAVLEHYRESPRIFPWRHIDNPWGVLVSELMLQQTQTDRVVSYWTRWMELWPRPADLARSSLDQVLREWSGLGYNRRARFLHECAKRIAAEHSGAVPTTIEALERLPGIGPYTSRAVACFAFNAPSVFIETNIRSVMLHFFFQGQTEVSDRDILPLLEESLDRENPRDWYYALMDYGAYLKKITANPSRRSRHYAKQSTFEGSLRQARGIALKELSGEREGRGVVVAELAAKYGVEEERMQKALDALEREGFLVQKQQRYVLRDG